MNNILMMLTSAIAINLLPMVGFAAEPDSQYSGWGMMGQGWGMGGGFMMILVWGAVIAVIVLAVRAFNRSGLNYQSPPPLKTPINILKERLASGEIDDEEFENRKRLL